ncbi:MAG: molybdopterin-dependent oxidoreductase [Candidatus Thiosymbion ectosymbiont of Robbea hypermnestra]|nr:molybdopterin-dependent oxidoreductase [Candidatus Thiosymbion ectosymbiont of Robbea hypermnestra]
MSEQTRHRFGLNPASNHPRMMTELEKASKRGCKIISVNPLREPGLVRFIRPKNLWATLLHRPTSIFSLYLQPLVGGDMALIKGMMKVLLEWDAQEAGGVLDQAFIRDHTRGFAACVRDLEHTTWPHIESGSGLSRAQITQAAERYRNAERVIACWGMGLTQQKHAVATLQTLTNWMLLGGHLGRPGAGLCPVRGHSNVQGDRTMGITVNPKPDFLAALGREFRFRPPSRPGYDTVRAIQAMAAGKAHFLVHPLPDLRPVPDQLRLTTIRSHDQYNTTIYGLNDRYRGIRGRRRVVFLHPEDMRTRGLEAGARVDLIGVAQDGLSRCAEDFEAVPYDLPRGCAGAYFPETNVLIPIHSYADHSITPTSKLILIRLQPAVNSPR